MWSTRYPNHYQQSLPPYALAQPSTSHDSRPHRTGKRPRRRSAAWQRPLLSAGLAALIGGTGVWLTEALIAPQASQAYTSRLDLFIARESGETYETLLRRAEMAARAGAQRSFDQDLLTTNVSVNVVVESSGITVPILSLRVDRDQWRARPETYYWATYYRTAETLLGTTPPGALGF
ncbi:MAG: hypothetical protein AAFP20_03415 [Cyanobacteria bacterium J06614_10]